MESSKSNLRTSKNHTNDTEKYSWDFMMREVRGRKHYGPSDYDIGIKQEFRARKSFYVRFGTYVGNAFRINFENSPEIGCFVKLTNSYCLIPETETTNFFTNTLEQDLEPEIPIIKTTICSCTILGRLCAGNKYGLLVPSGICDTELHNLKQQLPENIKINTLDDKLSALGNVIACNDKVALIHPDLDKESEEIIANTLQVEVFRSLLANNALPGSYSVFNNKGGLVYPQINEVELQNLSSLLEIPLTTGTVNGGSELLGAGMIVNDNISYCGMLTTGHEFSVIEKIYGIR